MSFIFDTIIVIAAMTFLLQLVGGLAIVFKVRNAMQNPFDRVNNAPPPPPPGNGDIIEGEYKVIEEKEKQ